MFLLNNYVLVAVDGSNNNIDCDTLSTSIIVNSNKNENTLLKGKVISLDSKIQDIKEKDLVLFDVSSGYWYNYKNQKCKLILLEDIFAII